MNRLLRWGATVPAAGFLLALHTGAGTLPCTEPAGNCQDYSTLGAFGSSGGSTTIAADDFTPSSSGNVTSICFWGAYSPDPNPDPPPTDDFTIRYYEDSGTGVPGSLLAEFTSAALTVTGPVDTGDTTGGGAARVFEYTATHAAVAVTADECYWVEISNPNDGGSIKWLWQWALTGNSWCLVDGPPPNGYDPTDVETNDLAFCLDLALGDPSTQCGPGDCGDAGSGGCDDPNNGSPGCDDAACCAAVCGAVPLCCLLAWDQSCVDTATSLGCFDDSIEACEVDFNCQVPDLMTHGGADQNAFFGVVSDKAIDVTVADDFTPALSGSINSVCWWGFYFDLAGGLECSPGPGDDFEITYYLDNGKGLPETVLASYSVTPTITAGGLLGVNLPVFRFDATHADLAVTAGECYWIEITNNLDGVCWWWWVTAGPGNGYSMQDQDGLYNVDDGQNWDLGWCSNLPLGSQTACAPDVPQECCPTGDIELTQSTDPDTVTVGNSIACNHNPGQVPKWNLTNYFARSYDLATIAETMGQRIEVQCVQIGVDTNNGSANTVTVNIYQDTNGGAPLRPGLDLTLLGTADVVVPANATNAFVTAHFDPPVNIPVDAVMVVETYLPSRSPSVDGDSGVMTPGSNALGQTAPSYIRAADCGFANYADLAGVGFPTMHLVQRVVTTASCRWDCQVVPNGTVGIQDFFAMFAQWGTTCVSCNFDGGKVGITDFFELFAHWGNCP